MDLDRPTRVGGLSLYIYASHDTAIRIKRRLRGSGSNNFRDLMNPFEHTLKKVGPTLRIRVSGWWGKLKGEHTIGVKAWVDAAQSQCTRRYDGPERE
jgi:hypothetical protein